MERGNYNKICSQKDIDLYDKMTNGLHDGYIVAFEYLNNGIKAEEGAILFDNDQTVLKLRVMVTSIKDNPIVELVFCGVCEWKFENSGYEILDNCFSLQENGRVIWTDEYLLDKTKFNENSYIIAKEVFWRVL